MDAQLYTIISDLVNKEDRDKALASCTHLLRAWPRITWADINEAICVLALNKLNAPEEGEEEGDAELVTADRLCELVEQVAIAFPEPDGESIEEEDEEEDDKEDKLRKLKKARQ
jgi:hypothetical protein